MLLQLIDGYLRRTRTASTRFGRDAVGDPNFVSNLRNGREPRASTIKRVRTYIEANTPHPMEPLR